MFGRQHTIWINIERTVTLMSAYELNTIKTIKTLTPLLCDRNFITRILSNGSVWHIHEVKLNRFYNFSYAIDHNCKQHTNALTNEHATTNGIRTIEQ